MQIAGSVHFADVAGVQPIVRFAAPHFATFPVAGGNIFSAHQNFSILSQPEFASGQNFADGAFGSAEGMIQADQRRCFRHAVALHHRETRALEKFFIALRKAAPPEINAQNFQPSRR